MRVLSFSLILFLVSCYGRNPLITRLKGESLPDFSLLMVDSTTYFQTKDIPDGKPIVILLFGPHCPYSKAQMDDIINHMDELKDIKIYAITPYPYKQMKSFYRDFQLNKYPTIVTGMDITNFFGQYVNARGIPYIAIYDKNKKLKSAYEGKIDSRIIKSAIN